MQHQSAISEIEGKLKIVEVLLESKCKINKIWFKDLKKIGYGRFLLLKDSKDITSVVIHRSKNVMVFQTHFPPFSSFGLTQNIDANKTIYVAKGIIMETLSAMEIKQGHLIQFNVGEKHNLFSGSDGALVTVIIQKAI